MTGQPNSTNWVFDAVAETLEIGGAEPGPGLVINNGAGNLQLKSTIKNSGGMSSIINGTVGEIAYFATQLDGAAPTTVALAPTAFTMTPPYPQEVLSAAFNTNGGAGSLNVGTWQVTVFVHFPASVPFKDQAAAFANLILKVI
jgi:hypothetical protein